MTDADRTDKAEERENMYIMMFTLQSLQNYGLSVKKTVERSLDYLWEWYQESGEERYLLLAKQHMQAYVNMGFALNEQNQTIRDIISILDQTIADFYPKDSLPGKRVKLTKAQIRSMIGRWRPSRENPMTIGELVEDIIKKVKEHQTGRYIYLYCRSDCTSGEDAEIYELVVGREESYFYDVRKFRFYTFMEETKKSYELQYWMMRKQIWKKKNRLQDSIFITDRQNLRLQHIRAWNGFCWASPKNSLISTFWMQRCQ